MKMYNSEGNMKPAYAVLINDLLQQYHFKTANLQAAFAVADEVRTFSLNDYAFRLSIGLEGLLSAAMAASDQESADALSIIVSQCNGGQIPFPVFNWKSTIGEGVNH